jgi:hypothetical protein
LVKEVKWGKYLDHLISLEFILNKNLLLLDSMFI